MEQQYCDRLRKYREANRLTQEELAEKIDVSRQTISKWERGEASPDTENLLKLSALYGMTIDELLKTDPAEAPVPPSPESEETDEDDEDGYGEEETEDDAEDDTQTSESERLLLEFPIAILCTIIFFCLGFFGGYWHPGWIVFLLIPIWDGLIRAIFERSLRRLPIPLLATAVYLILGCCFGLWHPGWLVFLLIPIFGYFT